MNLILWLKVLALGIVEGITEWLPISSTGHLVLLGEVLNPGMSEEFMKMFNVVIQLGAIMAVVVLYFGKLWPFHTAKTASGRNWFRNPQTEGFGGRFQSFANRYCHMDKIVMWLKICVSTLPAIVLGLPLDDWVEEHMHRPVPIASMLILYGVLFIVIEGWNKTRSPRVTRIRQLTWRDALLIGIFQVLAIIPGTSRSGATILGGILIGLDRTVAAEYTFYLAIPTMVGASLLKLVKFGFGFTGMEIAVLLFGMVVAFAVSVLAIKFLMSYIKRHDFKVFGVYRILLGILVLIFAFTNIL
ncbi:MAG: undecaprenyl-diphosphate phosphatase [Lachnospiraceae bacterium]|nr:undecaprenyl-diphosphate phosphatase [Lachnospiraceae bacterium]